MAGTFFSTDFSDFGSYDSDENSIKLFRRVIKELHLTGDPSIIKRYIFSSRRIARWFEDHGLQYVPVTHGPFASDCSRNVESACEKKGPGQGRRLGMDIAGILTEEMAGYDSVTVYKKAAAKSLTVSGGVVRGAVIEMSGEYVNVEAGIVILATGGAGGSHSSMCRYFPQLMSPGDELISQGMPACTGDGIDMASRIGAETGRHMRVHLLGPVYSGRIHCRLGMTMESPKALILNKDGHRMTNEEFSRDIQELANRSRGKVIYSIMDSDCMEEVWNETAEDAPEQSVSDIPSAYAGDLEKGCFAVADTIEDAAAFMGADPDTLRSEIDIYNACCASGVDDRMCKSPEFLRPVLKAPFYVLLGVRRMDSTQGGITVNSAFEAVTPSGQPIHGMLVVGDHVSGFVSEYYSPGGAGMTWAMVSGYLAGEDAAARINK